MAGISANTDSYPALDTAQGGESSEAIDPP